MFKRSSAVKELSKSGKNKITTMVDQYLHECVLFENDLPLSARQLSRKVEISQKSVMRVLRENTSTH